MGQTQRRPTTSEQLTATAAHRRRHDFQSHGVLLHRLGRYPSLRREVRLLGTLLLELLMAFSSDG